MSDRLASLLKWFDLRARVFQTGPLCDSARFDGADGLGYIHLLRNGRMRVETDGQPVAMLEEPAVLFYMAPATHRLSPGDAGADLLCASFEFGAGQHNPLVRAFPAPVVLPLAELPILRATLDLLFAEAAEQHCGRQAMLDRLMEVLIIQLLRELMDQHRIDGGLMAGLADPRLSKAITAMHADPQRAWTLEELASLAHMSRARFASHFRRVVGNTPMAHLGDWRLVVARSLLRRGRSVQAVADEVGYGSASALSRAFVAQLGVSPRAWRDEQRRADQGRCQQGTGRHGRRSAHARR